MDRRAFPAVLVLAVGCSPSETPNKAAASQEKGSATSPAAADDKPATGASAP